MTKAQIALLKKLNDTSKLNYNSLSLSDKDVCSYLKFLNFIDYDETTNTSTTLGVTQFYDEIESIKITEFGKAFLSESSRDNRRIWIPIIIDSVLSVSAIIISIIALML